MVGLWITHPLVRAMLRVLFFVQIGLLWISYYSCRLFLREDKQRWVIGVGEVANCLHHIAQALPGSITVNFVSNKYYRANSYHYHFGELPLFIARSLTAIFGPVLLGYLACRGRNFLYIWNYGFLINKCDGRAYEFRFLHARGKHIVCLFCGDDIRSPQRSLEFGRKIGYETMMSNIALHNPGYLSPVREQFLQRIAASADRYAEHIFNAPVDQISYITRPVHPFLYFYPDERFIRNDAKFEQMEVIRILHAPSSPLIKGTALVRAAVKRLREEGYRFDYAEITNADNAVVLEALKHAHIAINQLYAFLPGVFSIEVMAAHCALLTSADASIETSLPEDSRNAWLLTRYWDVTEKLRSLLDHPQRIKPLADAGHDWAKRHASRSASQARLRAILDGNIHAT
jgi:hypothetical protein